MNAQNSPKQFKCIFQLWNVCDIFLRAGKTKVSTDVIDSPLQIFFNNHHTVS